MAKVEVILPQMGEGIIEATITRWLADINTHVEEDDPIIEIATDKVDSEIPAPISGKLVKQFFSEGEVPKVGDVVAIIDDCADDEPIEIIATVVEQKKYETTDILTEEISIKHLDPKAQTESKTSLQNRNIQESQNISLFIRNFSRIRGVSSDEIKQIKGSGASGQIIKNDILNYINSGRLFKNSEPITYEVVKANANRLKNYEPKEGEEIVELDRTRLLIAQHMVRSVQTAPHVTSFVELDLTPLVEWRESVKEEFKNKNGFSITYTSIITDVVVKALKEYPGINVSFLPDNKLLIKKYINIGIATALPDSNLIVPVIKNADELNLTRLAFEISDKTSRARQGSLKPGETNGGTFTITNLGQVGNVTGTPIINQPESAILAVGAIKKKPGVVKNRGDYAIGVRDIITLSLSYDHRIIDGGLGGAFLSRIGELLESYKPRLTL